MLSFGRNKRRVYMAFFPRADGVTFHTALYVVPKNPSPGAKNSWRFDIHDLPVGNPAVVRWTYGFKMGMGRQEILNFPGQPVDCRSTRLLAMLFVGKLKGSVSIDSLRNFVHTAVDITAHDVSVESWRCHHWVMEIIDAMKAADLFADPVPQRGVDIWDTGIQFAQSLVLGGWRYEIPLPVCNVNGQPIDSEIPAAPELLPPRH